MFKWQSIPDVDPAEAVERQAAGAVLLDVREHDEWEAGHAPEAMHVPLGSLNRELSRFEGKTVLTVCRSGRRSAKGAKALRAAGVHAANVAGGMSAWAAAGLPLVRADGLPGTVL